MSHPPAVLLVQADEGARARLAAALRRDGMDVVEFAMAEQALAALGGGLSAAVLVTEPALGRLTDQELAEQAKDAASEITIILTPDPAAGRLDVPQGARCLPKPFEAAKLSRFIRLVAAKPALRAVLQRSYRAAQAEAPNDPVRAVWSPGDVNGRR
jgi:DNA-binding NtrC family response regulator